MRLASVVFIILLTFSAHAKLLDKILAVIDDKIITKSMVDRVRNNYDGRKEISPFIYSKKNPNDIFIIDSIINAVLIKEKLKELGYTIPDDFVESNIRSNEQRLGLTREKLLAFLRANNLTFSEYFELTRETIEFQHFNAKVIQPIISITDQEIKNAFYKKNINNKTLAFKYNLVDFYIPKRNVSSSDLSSLYMSLTEMQKGASLPEKFSAVSSNKLGDMFEDGLTPDLQKLLKQTDQGAFTKPILIGDAYHLFFIKSKDLVESELFIEAKEYIRAELFEKRATKLTASWLDRERNKHYIKYFFKK